ncbi:surface protease GP63 [Trypanosoma conorhini]|uniref:Leishmanolysin-like peptidase n=1 Tax=Trypanosoma conorhini TaxID=83891 RepID=A0A3R7KIC7_9TRYP|nr:surface protease GP63 [Trypanosoma conorhini]RNE95035.1 surface protease GP63 [Trypanosoma conorhini]
MQCGEGGTVKVKYLGAAEYVPCPEGSVIEVTASAHFEDGAKIKCPKYEEVCAIAANGSSLVVPRVLSGAEQATGAAVEPPGAEASSAAEGGDASGAEAAAGAAAAAPDVPAPPTPTPAASVNGSDVQKKLEVAAQASRKRRRCGCCGCWLQSLCAARRGRRGCSGDAAALSRSRNCGWAPTNCGGGIMNIYTCTYVPPRGVPHSGRNEAAV